MNGVREALKVLVRAVATMIVTPNVLSYRIRASVIGPNRALEGSTQFLAILPGIVGQYLRVAFLRRTLADCDRTVAVEYGTLFSQAGTRLGENVYIGPYCCIGRADIQRDVLLAAGVHVPSGAMRHGTRDVTTPIREQPGMLKIVTVGEGTWVGSTAVLLADVGKHCVVAAGAVVTKPIPDYSVAAGIPARVLRSRLPGDHPDACAAEALGKTP